MKIRVAIVAAAAAIALTACASAPKPLQGNFAEVLPGDVGSSSRVGDSVRWGGEIIAVETQAEQSCFELLGKRLRESARPSRGDESAGRFLACRSGFYDPVKFKIGRELTITGTVEGIETRAIGEFQYRYPRVAADVIYLWPDRELERRRPAGYWVGQHGNAWAGYWTPIFLPY